MVGLTDAQKAASFALVRDICKRWNIPMRKADKNGGITGHFSISPVDRAHCPGTFPWQDLFTFLNQQGDEMLQISDPFASTYFKQVANDRWQCNNGFSIFGGLLDFYRKTGGVLRLPLGNEQYTIPGVAWQQFEAGIAVYDPQNKLDAFHNPYAPCYLVKLDSPLAKQILGTAGVNLQPQLDAANAALASEKTANSELQTQLTKAQKDANAATTAAAQAVAAKNTAQTQAADYESQVVALNQQVAELKKQLENAPNKDTILNDLVAALQAAAKNIA